MRRSIIVCTDGGGVTTGRRPTKVWTPEAGEWAFGGAWAFTVLDVTSGAVEWVRDMAGPVVTRNAPACILEGNCIGAATGNAETGELTARSWCGLLAPRCK
jgi:hypothetical protein